MSPDFQASIRFVLKLVSLPWADEGKEVVPQKAITDAVGAVGRETCLSSRGEGDTQGRWLAGGGEQIGKRGPAGKDRLRSVFLPSNTTHTLNNAFFPSE